MASVESILVVRRSVYIRAALARIWHELRPSVCCNQNTLRICNRRVTYFSVVGGHERWQALKASSSFADRFTQGLPWRVFGKN